MATNVTQSYQVWLLDAALSSVGARAIVCDATAWGTTPSLEQIIASEIAQENGYNGRADVAPALAAAFNATTSRGERAYQDFALTASGGNLTYSGYAILNGGDTESNKVATATAASNQISCTGHGLANGDRVMVTADAGATQPTGLDALTRFYASVIDANTIELFEDDTLTTQATFTSDGSGTLRLRYANAAACGLQKNLGSTITLPPGQTHNFTGLIAAIA